MNRIVFIDVAKAICIILVVIGHYIPNNAPGWYVAMHDIIYTFHMPLFMFASGYVYIATKKDIGYGTFLLKKIKRLMIPYLTTSFIVISIKLLAQGNMSVDNPVTFMSYLKMLYLPEAGYFLWFIWALWWMFVLIPLFKTQKSRLLLFCVAFVLHYLPLELPQEFCIAQCKTMLVYFMLGIMAFEAKWIYAFVNTYKLYKVVVATILFAVVNYTNLTIGGGNFLVLILPYVGIVFTLELSKWIAQSIQTNKNVWIKIAASSYLIYLFHTTFEGFAKAVFRKMPFDSNLWYIFLPEAICIIVCGVIVPMILYYLFKKYRLTKMLFGL